MKGGVYRMLTFIGLSVITAPTNIATAQRAMMTEKTN